MICKKCGINLPTGTIRCPRCNEPQTLEATTAKELRAEASHEFVNGNYEKTVEILARASNLASSDKPELAKDIWLHKGMALAKLNRWQEALQSYDQALIYDSHDFFIWYQRGEALFRLGRYREALTAFDHALSVDPSDYLGLATAGKENTLRMLGR